MTDSSIARGVDERTFRELTEPYRAELRTHCYRMLGSMYDAEDALQETLLAAWRGMGEFQQRSSVRTWLYRIATNRCLNFRRAALRRPVAPLPSDAPEPTRHGEVSWLQPCPDALLDPQQVLTARASVELAFIALLQQLPPRQAAVLVLRDVLAFSAAEVADLLGLTPIAVKAALQRARKRLSRNTGGQPGPAPESPAERRFGERLRAGLRGRRGGRRGRAAHRRRLADHAAVAPRVPRPRGDRRIPPRYSGISGRGTDPAAIGAGQWAAGIRLVFPAGGRDISGDRTSGDDVRSGRHFGADAFPRPPRTSRASAFRSRCRRAARLFPDGIVAEIKPRKFLQTLPLYRCYRLSSVLANHPRHEERSHCIGAPTIETTSG